MSIPFINDFLKRKRKDKGITQEKFADMIFKSLPTVGRYDMGAIIPESVLQRSCDILGIDFFMLLKGQEEESLEGFESWEEADKFNNSIIENGGIWTDNGAWVDIKEGIIEPPYEKLLRKYKNELKNISISQLNNNITSTTLSADKTTYNISSLKVELNNYLELKNNLLNIPSDKRENKEKIEKILSFIDFLYFDDIIKK